VAKSSFFSPVVAQLVPYVPGKQPKLTNLVKLNTNENPYPPSPKVIAARSGLPPKHVFVGNGSDGVLAHAFFAFFQISSRLLLPDFDCVFQRTWTRRDARNRGIDVSQTSAWARQLNATSWSRRWLHGWQASTESMPQ
jgi:hypothetical protein